MDYSGASDRPGPGRRPSSPSSGTPIGAKGQAAQCGQRPKEKIAPFHNSPIVSGNGAFRSKRPGAASGRPLTSPGSLFQDTPGRLTALPVRERLVAAAAGSTAEHAPSSGSLLATTGVKAQASPLVVQINGYSDDRLKSVKQFHVKCF